MLNAGELRLRRFSRACLLFGGVGWGGGGRNERPGLVDYQYGVWEEQIIASNCNCSRCMKNC